MHEWFSGIKDGIQYRNGSPQLPHDQRMPTLPMKVVVESEPPKLEPLRKKKIIRKKRQPGSTAVTHRQTAKVLPPASKPKKAIPRSAVSQPRDHLGRFVSYAIHGIRTTARWISGSAQKTSKAVKTVQRTAKKRSGGPDGLVKRRVVRRRRK